MLYALRVDPLTRGAGSARPRTPGRRRVRAASKQKSRAWVAFAGFIATLICLAVAGPASANVLWKGDYETGGFGQWNELQAGLNGSPGYSPANVGYSRGDIVTSPIRQGTYAAKYTVQPGDANDGTARAEVYTSVANTRGAPGQDAYYAWSTMIPSSPNQASGWSNYSNWNVFNQWHDAGTCNNTVTFGIDPTLAGGPQIYFEQDEYSSTCASVTARRRTNLGLQYDHWYDFVVHIKWSTDPAVGYFEVWMDGRRVVPLTYGATLNSTNGDYWKQGFYRGDFNATNVVYHDGARVTDSFADAAAGFPIGSAFNPTTASVSPVPFNTWFTGAFVDSGCSACQVLQTGEDVEAVTSGAVEDRDSAFAEKDFGGTSGLSGRIYYRDVVHLPAGENLQGNMGLFRVLDTQHREVFDIYLDSSRRIGIFSPVGGLRSTELRAVSTVAVPNDGVTLRKIEVSALANNSVTVRIDGVDYVSTSGLTGATTSNQRYYQVGTEYYDGVDNSSTSETLHSFHRQSGYSQTGWLG